MKKVKVNACRKTPEKVSVHQGPTLKADVHMYAWARPYNDPNIIDVFTGLDRGFKYSPIFRNCVADTMVELTGYRRKDYVIAENQTGKEHIPKVTVWHHAWDEKNGKYRMQLVDFVEHKKTCPHAGGCKLWLINTKKKSKYAIYRKSCNESNQGRYSDLTMIYPVENGERAFYQNGYVSKKTLAVCDRKRIKLVGVDVYGNLLYKNEKHTYFWDHEFDLLIPVKSEI